MQAESDFNNLAKIDELKLKIISNFRAKIEDEELIRKLRKFGEIAIQRIMNQYVSFDSYPDLADLLQKVFKVQAVEYILNQIKELRPEYSNKSRMQDADTNWKQLSALLHRINSDQLVIGQDDEIYQQVIRLYDHENYWARKTVVNYLEYFPHVESIPNLVKLAHDPNQNIGAQAVYALFKIGAPALKEMMDIEYEMTKGGLKFPNFSNCLLMLREELEKILGWPKYSYSYRKYS